MFEVGRLVARIALEGTESFGRQLKQVGASYTYLDEKGRNTAASLGTSMGLIGAAIIAFVGLAVARFASFDKAMSAAAAATEATADEQRQLQAAALEAGAATVYSAEQSANAITELGRAGVSTSSILGGGLSGSLALAAAGQIEVADAAAVAATAMTQFRLSGEQIPHLADLLAAGANKAQGGVSDLSMALKQSGLVASQMGLSVEDTIGTLTAFASAGLIGSDAGTSFRTMLLSLASPSKQAADELKKYNIQAYDAKGNFVGISALAGQLKTNLSAATQAERDHALSVIFGSDAIRAANVLYNQGEEGIREWTNAVDDSGAAARTAAQLQDNLAGDVEKLGGAFDSALIKSGSGANDVLRLIVQTAGGLLDLIGDIPAPVLTAGLALTGIVGTILLVGGAAVVAVPKVVAFRSTLTQLGISGGLAAKALGLASGALAVAGIAFALFAARQAQATANTSEFKDSLDQGTGAITEYTRELVAKKLAEAGAFEAAKEAGISQKELTDAVLEGGDALDKVKGKFTDTNTLLTFFTGVGIRSGNASMAVSDLADNVEQAGQNLEDEKAAADGSAKSTKEAADSYLEAADQAGKLQENLETLIATINESNSVGQDAITANAAYQKTLADVDETIRLAKEGVEGYSLGLDESTAAGAANAAMLVDLADDAQAAAAAQFALNGDTDAYLAALTASHQAIYDRAIALGATADQAQALADKIAKIPTNTEIKILVDSAAAQAKLDAINKAMAAIRTGSKQPGAFSISGGIGDQISSANGNLLKFYANGGQHEGHTAQIARAGTTRVWNEPETQGELYAPMALSKRPQSVAIVRQAVNEWGYDLVPRGSSVMHAADGALTGGGSPASLDGLRISGTLDLGNGLIGFVDGRIATRENDRELDSVGGRPV